MKQDRKVVVHMFSRYQKDDTYRDMDKIRLLEENRRLLEDRKLLLKRVEELKKEIEVLEQHIAANKISKWAKQSIHQMRIANGYVKPAYKEGANPNKIMELMELFGITSIEGLAQHCNVSPATIRRRLKDMKINLKDYQFNSNITLKL